jgi:hypothetical protein
MSVTVCQFDVTCLLRSKWEGTLTSKCYINILTNRQLCCNTGGEIECYINILTNRQLCCNTGGETESSGKGV